MEKNVLIPLSLLERTIELLDIWDVSGCKYDVRYDYGSVLWELKVKIQKLELRDAYVKIIKADNHDARDLARIEYLRLKSKLGDVDVEIVF